MRNCKNLGGDVNKIRVELPLKSLLVIFVYKLHLQSFLYVQLDFFPWDFFRHDEIVCNATGTESAVSSAESIAKTVIQLLHIIHVKATWFRL